MQFSVKNFTFPPLKGYFGSNLCSMDLSHHQLSFDISFDISYDYVSLGSSFAKLENFEFF